MIVIDKEIDALLRFADKHYIVEKGEIVWSGDSDALEADKQAQDAYLSV